MQLNLKALIKEEKKKRLGEGAQRPPELAPFRLEPRGGLDLSAHQVGWDRVPGLHFIPSFLSPGEEAQLLEHIYAAPEERWVAAASRRVQNWGGRPGEARIREELPDFLKRLVDAMVEAGLYQRDQAPNHILINEYHGGAGLDPHGDGPLYSPRVALITLSGSALLEFWRLREGGGEGAGYGERPPAESEARSAGVGTGGSTAGAPVEAEEEGSSAGGGSEGGQEKEEDGWVPVVGKQRPAAQVLMAPRSLLLVTGEAYNRHLHGIRERKGEGPFDPVEALCANAEAVGAPIGGRVPRGARRLSIVCVHKLLEK